MKSPESKLPWNYHLYNDKGSSYTICDSEGLLVLDTTDYYDYACNNKDAEYIVQAANLFPECIRLLKEALDKLTDDEAYKNYLEIKQFLTKLENEE